MNQTPSLDVEARLVDLFNRVHQAGVYKDGRKNVEPCKSFLVEYDWLQSSARKTAADDVAEARDMLAHAAANVLEYGGGAAPAEVHALANDILLGLLSSMTASRRVQA